MSTNEKLEKELNLSKEFKTPTYNEWKDKVEADLKGASFEKKLITKTYEGIDLKPIYAKEDLKDTDGYPGFGNYKRGTNASGYLKNDWLISQEFTYGEADEFNRALKHDLKRGQNSINISLDRATQLGLDADYASTEDVGKGGLSVSGLNSFSRTLNDIDITKYPLFIQAGFSAVPMLSILSAYAKETNTDLQKINGSVEADPLGFLAAEGQLPITLDFAFDKMKASVLWTKTNAPDIKTINVSSIPYHNGGASAVQELAFVIATAVEYLRELVKRGVDVDIAAHSFKLTFGVGPFFFMEISKFRAARILWKNIVDSFSGKQESAKIFIHGKTSSFNQTLYDPYVNMLRTTTEAFSAVAGGINSLHTNPFDESFSVPDEFSRRIARNTQIILNEETHLGQLIDPAGGSFYVETLTNELAESAWAEFKKIEKLGGMFSALKEEYIQKEVERVFREREKDITKRRSVIVGTNMYANPKEEKLERKEIDHKLLKEKRAEFLQKFRVSGNQEINNSIMEKLNELIDTHSEDIIDIGAEAILAGATLGEISHAARAATEDSVKIKTIEKIRSADPFEELRNISDKIEEESGSRPKVFLVTMGLLKQFKARADFSRGFFEVGGFDVIYPDGFISTDDAVKAALKSDAQAVVICSTDDTYPELVPKITKRIKSLNTNITVILAGYPKDQIEEHKKNGVDEFIYLGSDAHAILLNILNTIMNS